MVPRAALAAALVTGALLTSCKGKDAPSSKPSAEPAIPTAQVTQAAPPPSGSQAPAPSGLPAPTASSSAGASAGPSDVLDAGVDSGKEDGGPRSDAGPPPLADDCKLVRGPAQLSFTGPVSFAFGGGVDPRFIFNREGALDLQSPVFKDPKPSGGGGLLPKKPDSAPKTPFIPEQPASQERSSWPACAVARQNVFCMDSEGAIHRRSISGEGDTIVGRGRAGTPLAAVSLGDEHTFLALLANQKTTEGIITQAFTILNNGPSILVSEEGSGATFITLAAREKDVLAVYIDARVALTPIHARTLSVANGKLKIGRDAVIFMGGGADRRLAGAIAWSGAGPAYALITTTDPDDKFGMAAIPVGDEPKDDTPAVWSYYPREITQAPIAATVGVSPVRVARVRPVSADASSWRVLELGHLDGSGHFNPLCNIVESRAFTDVAIAVSPGGSVWIVYTSADGTWVEQRGRP